MRGRKPDPTRLKLAKGVDKKNKDRINLSEPKPEPAYPECPKWLPLAARKEWKRIGPELLKLGILTNIDRGVLTGYCLACADMQTAQKNIKKLGEIMTTPRGYQQQNPYVGMKNKAASLMLKFAAELGLSPSARSRISVEKKGQKSELAQIIDGTWQRNKG